MDKLRIDGGPTRRFDVFLAHREDPIVVIAWTYEGDSLGTSFVNESGEIVLRVYSDHLQAVRPYPAVA